MFGIDSVVVSKIQDETGAFLIDRDPKYFAPVLNYLRHGKLVIEKNLQEEGVLEEAEFYNLNELIHLDKERIKERELAKNSHNVKRVYRVIQFKETEITQMMSTMSDGWRFEQIVNVGSHYNYTSDDHSEYLLIVSKEYGMHDFPNEAEASDKRKVNTHSIVFYSYSYSVVLFSNCFLIFVYHFRKLFNMSNRQANMH